MAQTAAGGLKLAAAATGLSVDDYLARREGGEKWCTRCKGWHEVGAFGSDKARPDGLAASCRASRQAHYAKTYVPKQRPECVSEERWAVLVANAKRGVGPFGVNRLTGKPGPVPGMSQSKTPRKSRSKSGVKGSRRGRPKGWHHTPETRAKIRDRLRDSAARGEAIWSYRDGKVAERRGERFSQAYRRWRFDVFSRDRFTCQRCGDDRGGNLVGHHIKGFAAYPDLRYDLDNGLTLCRPCHDEWHREHGYG